SDILTKEIRRGTGFVYHCKACDHGFLEGQEKIDAKTYYAEEYRKEYSYKSTVASTNAEEIFDIYSKYQGERLPLIFPYLAKDKNLIEVGASSGQFLVHVLDKVASVEAIELDIDCCNYLENKLGISADSEYLPNSKFADKKYDIVCSFQVMEHV